MADQVDEDFLKKVMFAGSSIAGWKSIDPVRHEAEPIHDPSAQSPMSTRSNRKGRLCLHWHGSMNPNTGEMYDRATRARPPKRPRPI